MEPPTAVFCADDLALWALYVAQQRFRVPEDISIVGLDDINGVYHVSPPLNHSPSALIMWVRSPQKRFGTPERPANLLAFISKDR
jgi:hypothetical protein